MQSSCLLLLIYDTDSDWPSSDVISIADRAKSYNSDCICYLKEIKKLQLKFWVFDSKLA